MAYLGDQLNVTCIADKPRYQFSGSRPLPPIQVTAFFDGDSKICRVFNKQRASCVYNVKLSKTGSNFPASCRARNSAGECRTKTLLLTVLERNSTGKYAIRAPHNRKSFCNLLKRQVQKSSFTIPKKFSQKIEKRVCAEVE